MFDRSFLLVCLASLAAMSVRPADAQTSPWYGGASAGPSAAKIDDATILAGFAAAGLPAGTIDHSDRATAYRLFGGYRLLPHLALEGGYFDLGRFGFSAGADASGGTLVGHLQARGLNLDLVGDWPVAGKLSAIGRLGVAEVHSRDAFEQTGSAVLFDSGYAHTRSGVGYQAGAGIEYAATPAWGLRLEAQGLRFDDPIGRREIVRLISFGLVYRFGADLAVNGL
jgi:OmpA-OmpF porin, OOP family